VHGELFRPAELPGLIAVSVAKPDGPPLGLLTYRLHPGAGPGPDCEIVTLNADPPGRATGTALVTEVRAVAEAAGCRRIWLVTTNDNLGALAFYQKRDFRLVAVHPGAVDRARRLKPEIPAAGEHGIPLRDEIELELTLPGTEERPGR